MADTVYQPYTDSKQTPHRVQGYARTFTRTPDAFVEQALELLENAAARSSLSRQAIAACGEWQHRQLTILNAAITG